jgi:hypothetical protein
LLCSSVFFKATEKHRKAQIILAVFICVLLWLVVFCVLLWPAFSAR